MPSDSETYRMSCATQRCTARSESCSVLDPATSSASFASSAGVIAKRSLASPAYQRAMSSHVVVPTIWMWENTVSGDPANGSRSMRGTSCVAHTYTRLALATVTCVLNLPDRSCMRGCEFYIIAHDGD